MAKAIRAFCVAALLTIGPFPSSQSLATGFNHVLKPGRYKIEVIVENPRNGQQTSVRHVERCLEPQAIANHVIFEMLSDTPATHCPKYEICAGEVRTGFVAQCIPASSTSAVGMFALEPGHFRGRIEVKNADDKLTNVEIQYGDWLGDCDPDVPDRTMSNPVLRE